jgi:hypothetical protein
MIRRNCPRIICESCDASVLARQYLDETYNIEYSIPRYRWALSYQNPRTVADRILTSKTRSAKNAKNQWKMDTTVVCIDQAKRSIQIEPRTV